VPNTTRWLTPEEGLAAHDAAAALLAAVLRGTPAEARGDHGQPTDAEGFAAMRCDEVFVHGYDIARGLGVAFTSPQDLARHVCDPLFPWTPLVAPGRRCWGVTAAWPCRTTRD